VRVDIRKVITVVEETRREGMKEVDPPLTKVAVAAVLANPYAGRYEEDLSEFIDAGEELGEMLATRAAATLGRQAESYGKAGIVGLDGELEHVAALIHPKFGNPLRDAIGGGKAIIPSAKKRGGPGSSVDIPLHYKDAAFVRTHFDAMELRVLDAPHPNEIVIAVALSDGGRPHARVGGLQISEVKGEDGLR
jgi:Amino acid synthesis